MTLSTTRQLGVIFFLGGLTGALLLLGGDGALLAAPQPLDPTTRGPLLLVFLFYGLSFASMTVGVILAWSWRTGPRALMLVVTCLVGMLCGPSLFSLSADLVVGLETQPTVVLGQYDCDITSPRGDVHQLTCVELMWEKPTGQIARERFLIEDALLESGPALRGGDCIGARIWAHSEVLAGFRDVRREHCERYVQ